MGEFLFIILVFVGLPIGIGLLPYFISKKLGYPKTGKYLTIIFGLFVLSLVFYVVFEDEFFTKSNAKELVEEQDLQLIDQFDLLNNEAVDAIVDYYHTFTLRISERDKQNAISKIKSADNFQMNTASIENIENIEILPYYSQTSNRYFGEKVIQNYETEDSYIREYFEPSGKEGYAPTFRRISISKTKNELTFEDIVE